MDYTSYIRYAYSLTHQMFDAQDLVQEAILKALEKGNSDDNYIARIIHNEFINSKRAKKEILCENMSFFKDIPELKKQQFEWSILDQLTSKCKIVISLRFKYKMKTKEIAELLNKKHSTIRGLSYRALKQLKQLI